MCDKSGPVGWAIANSPQAAINGGVEFCRVALGTALRAVDLGSNHGRLHCLRPGPAPLCQLVGGPAPSRRA